MKKKDKNRQLFCKQVNKCVSLLRKAECSFYELRGCGFESRYSHKKGYFTRSNERHIAKNKYFWETVKFFLSSRLQSSQRIKLYEEDDTVIQMKKKLLWN